MRQAIGLLVGAFIVGLSIYLWPDTSEVVIQAIFTILAIATAIGVMVWLVTDGR